MMKPILLLILLAAASHATSQQEYPSFASRYDPLVNWLSNLTVAIPDQHFKESVFTLAIRDMTCSKFAVETINSTYIPSSTADSLNPSLDLAVAGISATCQGIYHTTGLSGQVSATVASSSTENPLQLSLAFQSNTTNSSGIRMATSVSTQLCETNLNVAELYFTGSISAKLINLFRSEIRGYVSKALSTELCPVLDDTIDTQLTNLLQQADRYMMRLIANETKTSLHHKKATPAWNWSRDAPLVPAMLRLLNLVILDPFLNEGIVLKILQAMLGHDVDDNCGYFFRGWNGLLEELTNGSIEFQVPNLAWLRNISIIIPNYASISLLPKHVRISRIDKLDQLQFLFPLNITNLFGTKLVVPHGMDVSLEMDIVLSETAGGTFQGDDLLESFQVSINTSSLDFGSSLSLDLNSTRMRTTTMKHVLSAVTRDTPTDLGCSLSPIETFVMNSLVANVEIQSVSFLPKNANASLEHDMDAMINNFLTLFLTEYDKLVTLAFAGLLNGPAKQLAETALNNWVQNLIQTLLPNGDDSSCRVSGVVNTTAPDYFNFSAQATFLNHFNDFLNDSRVPMNAYLACVADVVTTHTKSASPTVEFGGATLQLQNLAIDRVGSIEGIELLSPEADGYHLSNSLRYGVCRGNETDNHNVTCSGPILSASSLMSIPLMNVSGTANFTAALGSIQESASALLLYDLNQLKNLSLFELLSCQTCLAQPALEAVLYAAPILIDHISFGVEAELKGYTAEAMYFRLDSASYEAATSAIVSAISWFQMSVIEVINQTGSHLIKTAQATCHLLQVDHEKKGLTAILSVVVFLLPLYILSHIAYLAFCQASGPGSTDEEEPAVEYDDMVVAGSEAGAFDVLLEKNASLMTNDSAPSGFRHVFPVLLIATIALLAVSNLSVGATVDLSVTVNNVPSVIRLPSLFAFSLGNTIREMYQAGIYILLFIVVVFSGAWPYLKLLIMLWAWVAPESMLSLKRRGKLLFSLDALSKFSLVDTFVLVIMMVSFRFHLNFGSYAVVDVFVNPHYGFYGFLIATTISLLAGHVELHFHRRCAIPETMYPDNTCWSLFSYHYSYEGRKYRLSVLLKAGLVVIMTVTFALLTIGSLRKSFTFEFGGLAGKLLGENSTKSHSLISIGTSISRSVEDSDGPGIMFLQVVYFFYACIMPSVCLLALTILMVVPMKCSQQELCLTVAEVGNAWSALEVFVMSIVAALFEISTFASFIVGHTCDILNQILQDQFDDQLDGDDVCYSLSASASSNMWLLVVGVALNSALVSTLLRMAQTVVEERSHSRDDASCVVHRIASTTLSKWLLEPVEEGPLAVPLLNDSQQAVQSELDDGGL